MLPSPFPRAQLRMKTNRCAHASALPRTCRGDLYATDSDGDAWAAEKFVRCRGGPSRSAHVSATRISLPFCLTLWGRLFRL